MWIEGRVSTLLIKKRQYLMFIIQEDAIKAEKPSNKGIH